MKELIIILTVAIASCTGKVKTDKGGNENSKGQENAVTVVQLNNGSKWKTDEATKKNVAALVKVVNDSSYVDATKRRELIAKVKSKIDTLIAECTMKGPEHDALHVWLETVLRDMKELKEEDDDYIKTYAALKNDIGSFYRFFE